GDDTFTLGALLTGSVDGEGGLDTLNLNAAAGATLTGSTANGYAGGSAGNVSGGFGGLNTPTGPRPLTGGDGASTWTGGASQTYDDNAGNGSLTFSGFGTLQGGTGNDTFTVAENSIEVLKGGAGNDSFSVAAGKTLTGSISGENDDDSVNLASGGSVSGA